MTALALKIHIVEQNVRKMMQFDPATLVYDACRIIREKITEANLGQGKNYVWLFRVHYHIFALLNLFNLMLYLDVIL